MTVKQISDQSQGNLRVKKINMKGNYQNYLHHSGKKTDKGNQIRLAEAKRTSTN